MWCMKLEEAVLWNDKVSCNNPLFWLWLWTCYCEVSLFNIQHYFFIQDPRRNLIQQWLVQNGKLGKITKQFKISKFPVLGDWSIHVQVNVSMHNINCSIELWPAEEIVKGFADFNGAGLLPVLIPFTTRLIHHCESWLNPDLVSLYWALISWRLPFSSHASYPGLNWDLVLCPNTLNLDTN